MFGYVTIYKDELLVREFNEYKSVYCGLCRTLGTEYSKLSRFILSYDCTFYALLLLSLNGECPGYEKKMCRCNPLKKCTYIKNGEDALSKASALSVVSVYFKIVDNISDSKGIKKLAYKFLKPIAKKWANKAKEKYPYIYNAVETMSKEQFIVESKENQHTYQDDTFLQVFCMLTLLLHQLLFLEYPKFYTDLLPFFSSENKTVLCF